MNRVKKSYPSRAINPVDMKRAVRMTAYATWLVKRGGGRGCEIAGLVCRNGNYHDGGRKEARKRVISKPVNYWYIQILCLRW